jgi:hypothetical protein
MFIAAGLIVAFQVRGRLNHFMASLIMASMGVVFAWISFYGNDAGFSGAGSILSELTQIPFDRAMFGLGALFCLCGSAYAFVRFVRG